MAGTSVTSSQSTSTSTPVVPNLPQTPLMMAIAQYAQQVGSQVYDWAQGQFAKDSNLTDANIQNYLNTSANALGQANQYQNEYNNKITPEANQLIDEANSYASPSRMAQDMGAAESGQMQAADAARQNSERDLQSFGIDPSSGRYAALDRASQVSAAAAAAGSAQQAQRADIATGQNLRQQALQFGETLPGATTNSLNTGLQGIAGAENAGLANANTGVALQGAANPFLQTASSLKYSPLGQQTNSQSTSQGTSNTTDPAQTPKDPASNSGSGSGSGGGSSNQPGTGGASGSPNTNNQIDVPGSGSTDTSGGGGLDASGNPISSDPFSTGSGTDLSGAASDPFSSAFPTDSIGGSYDPTSGASLSDFSNGNFTDTSGGAPSDGSVGDSIFAQGGPVDDNTGAIPEDGGQIPQSASPSGGMQTDDIQAQGPKGPINVNANEFVIPQDVALWKGQEFFQKLIAQSRQARVMAPAKPSRPMQGMR